MNGNYLKSSLLFLFLLAALTPFSQQPAQAPVFVADPLALVQSLRPYALVLVDSANKLKIESILQKGDGDFYPLQSMKEPARPGISYWLKIPFVAKGDMAGWWLLMPDTSYDDIPSQHDVVDVWITDSAGKLQTHQRTGALVPRSEKMVKKNPGLNRVLFSAREGEAGLLYIKIFNKTEPVIIGSPELRSSAIPLGSRPGATLLTVLFSIVFFFSLTSFFFFLLVRGKDYLFFGIYTLFLSIHYLILHPDIPFVDFFIPEHPWLAGSFFILFAMGGFIVFIWFGRHFINLSKLSPRLDKLVKWIALGWAASLILTISVKQITGRFLPPWIHYIFLLSFIAYLVRLAFFKSVLARFYVVGALWLMLFTLLGLFGERIFGPLPFKPWPIGQVGQILIYTVGLAYKLRVSEKEKARAEMLSKHNEELTRQKTEIEDQKKALEETLSELNATQAQLIQSEKMASLGQLTAGIAHEIQNPLNFVNNFSEVNGELIDELNEQLAKGNMQEAKQLARDIKDNEEKINHHGKRADTIVKSMLQHSRVSAGKKELTDINALADEYLRLAYHGLRAKDNSFNTKLETALDPAVGEINIVPQDIGRVLINLINNAFYAVSERKKGQESESKYEPMVRVLTRKRKETVEIVISDNGNGIPSASLEKIFQPFFTTKPSGQGTGLGLSLSYDIVKAHGGELSVETKEGGGTAFTIALPSE